MATAVDKWPAYARLSAVAQAGHLPHSSYTITRDTTLAPGAGALVFRSSDGLAAHVRRERRGTFFRPENADVLHGCQAPSDCVHIARRE